MEFELDEGTLMEIARIEMFGDLAGRSFRKKWEEDEKLMNQEPMK